MQTVWETINGIFVSNGLKIFPIGKNSKIPCISKWNEECSSNFMQILYWYENAKGCNWGLPCKENNLFVLDLDKHDVNKDGVENFKKLCKDLNINLPDTLIQQTPSGGLHYIFKTDEDLKRVNGVANAFEKYQGIDIRNSNYIVVTPSVINEKQYVFLNKNKPQPMPKELKKFILENVGTKEEKKKSQYTKPTEVYVGNRDTALFEYINNLYYKTRLDYDEILTLAKRFNEEVLEKPFAERTIVYKVKKAFEKDRSCCMYLWLGDKDEEVKDN